ncbi:MAG: hypothetical protein IPJ82_21045 [Lewinellaceae bacterium]|nr:hypothetical protein [Lewinellaceae bacterium]
METLTLWTLTFKIYGLDINPDLEKMIHKASKLSSIFSELLSNRDKIPLFPRWINEFVDRASEIKSGVSIFVDDVDQAFETIMINNHHYNSFYLEDQSKPAVEIWVNGQNALFSSIYSIHRQNRHVKIFATVRTEAFHCLKVALKPNYLHHSVVLHYDKWNIEEIFNKNIQLIPKEKLAKPEGKTWIEKFLGFEEMPHRFAKDHLGNPRIETSFNFIFRHTYGRPREIVQMGSSLHNLVTQPHYKSLKLYNKIEEVRANVTISPANCSINTRNKSYRVLIPMNSTFFIPYRATLFRGKN